MLLSDNSTELASAAHAIACIVLDSMAGVNDLIHSAMSLVRWFYRELRVERRSTEPGNPSPKPVRVHEHFYLKSDKRHGFLENNLHSHLV